MDPGAEAVLFVVSGTLALTVGATSYEMAPGGYAYLPPGSTWTLHNETEATATFHWIRKRYQRVEGVAVPEALVTNEREVAPVDDARHGRRVVDDALRRDR